MSLPPPQECPQSTWKILSTADSIQPIPASSVPSLSTTSIYLLHSPVSTSSATHASRGGYVMGRAIPTAAPSADTPSSNTPIQQPSTTHLYGRHCASNLLNDYITSSTKYGRSYRDFGKDVCLVISQPPSSWEGSYFQRYPKQAMEVLILSPIASIL
jgi:hypothetical protein